MATVKLTGAIHTLFNEEKYRDFIKRVLWLKEVNVQYPNVWQIEFHHDGVNELIGYKNADVVEIEVEVRGKSWTPRNSNEEKIINILKGVSIKKI